MCFVCLGSVGRSVGLCLRCREPAHERSDHEQRGKRVASRDCGYITPLTDLVWLQLASFESEGEEHPATQEGSSPELDSRVSGP